MVRRYQIRLMRSVNARCVSIGLVLALSNCSESGGEPDAMLDMHHPGTGIDSHHPQFHNSYGNMKFIIIVINPPPPYPPRKPRYRARGSHALALAALLKSSTFFAARFFSFAPFPPPLSFSAPCVQRWTTHRRQQRQTSFAIEPPRNGTCWRNYSSLLPPYCLLNFCPHYCPLFLESHISIGWTKHSDKLIRLCAFRISWYFSFSSSEVKKNGIIQSRFLWSFNNSQTQIGSRISIIGPSEINNDGSCST